MLNVLVENAHWLWEQLSMAWFLFGEVRGRIDGEGRTDNKNRTGREEDFHSLCFADT